MKDTYDFITTNGFGVLVALYMFGRFWMFIWNRLMRHLNIRKHGWPPPHCDADGDFAEVEEEGEEDEDSEPRHSPSDQALRPLGGRD